MSESNSSEDVTKKLETMADDQFGKPMEASDFPSVSQADFEAAAAAAVLSKETEAPSDAQTEALGHAHNLVDQHLEHEPEQQTQPQHGGDFYYVKPDRSDEWRAQLAALHAGELDGEHFDDVEMTDTAVDQASATARRLLGHVMREAPTHDAFARDLCEALLLAVHYANLDEASTKKGRAARRTRKAERDRATQE